MKQFVTDRLIEEDNFCNFQKEKVLLRQHIQSQAHVVLYGPRNFGKTSLLKNILIPEFRKTHKKSFVFFADLMEAKSMDMLVSRMKSAFEHSFEESFPVKNLVQSVKDLLTHIRPIITIDSLTSQPGLSISLSSTEKNGSIPLIFGLIKDISKKIPCLVVIDEFQDIAEIPEAQAFFRAAFQDIHSLPIILLGSKRQILSEIFSNPNAPLAFWGQDLEIGPIGYEDYHAYIQERFSQRHLTIRIETASYLQDLVHRVPESVNMLCQQLWITHSEKEITLDDVRVALKAILSSKESRYESYLSRFSAAEQSVLVQLSRIEKLRHPQSKAFVSATRLTSRTVGKIINKLYTAGIIEKEDHSYRISDPLLAFYLRSYR